MAAHIGKRGRVAMGWEEIMHGDNLGLLRKDVAIMPWLSVANGVKSANAGHPVIHTTIRPFYLDSRQDGDPREPAALIGGPHTLQMLHRFELFPQGLTPEGRRNILGAQGQLWTELMPRTDDVEYQAFPRACAIAELTWTAPERRADTADFIDRLSRHGERLNALNLNHRRVPPPPGLGWSPEFLAVGKPWVASLPRLIAERVRPGSTLRVDFRYQSGGHGLDIAGVELLSDGKPIASDNHVGFTGTHPKAADYRLVIPADVKLGRLELRIRANGSGGGDSRGVIELVVE
jgi:hexosaminidase